MYNKKAQESGGPMNTVVVIAIIAIVLGGIFFFIIRAELTKKLSELPLEEEVQGEVTVPDICPVRVGYFAQGFSGIDDKKTHLYLYQFYPQDTQTSFPNGIYTSNEFNRLWINNMNYWGAGDDIPIGSITKSTGGDIGTIRFYCNAPELVKPLLTPYVSDNVYATFNGAFFIAGLSLEGKKILCKENRVYSIFECLGGDAIANRLKAYFAESYFVSMKRGGKEMIRVNCGGATGFANVKEKLNYKTRIGGDFGTTYDYTYADPEAGGGADVWKREMTFVWDEANKKAFANFYIRFNGPIINTGTISIEDFKEKNYADAHTFIKNRIAIGSTEDEALSVALYYIITSKTKEEFIQSMQFMVGRVGELLPEGDKNYDIGTVPIKELSKNSANYIIATLNDKSDIDKLSSQSCTYECLFDNKWERCIQKNWNFCSSADEKKCIDYQWGDKFELFNPFAISSYNAELTRQGVIETYALH